MFTLNRLFIKWQLNFPLVYVCEKLTVHFLSSLSNIFDTELLKIYTEKH